jgi:hypothetical protein
MNTIEILSVSISKTEMTAQVQGLIYNRMAHERVTTGKKMSKGAAIVALLEEKFNTSKTKKLPFENEEVKPV